MQATSGFRQVWPDIIIQIITNLINPVLAIFKIHEQKRLCYLKNDEESRRK